MHFCDTGPFAAPHFLRLAASLNQRDVVFDLALDFVAPWETDQGVGMFIRPSMRGDNLCRKALGLAS